MSSIKFWIRYPAVTLTLTALIVFAGVHAFLRMQRTEDPTITIRTGLVAALYPGATSDQVAEQVTKTLEKHIFKFAEVRKEKTYSTSRPGLVVINVELEDNITNSDQFWAKLRHEMNLVKATELPAGVKGPVVDSDFGDTVAMLVAIRGSRYGYRELRDFADTIQDEMRTVRDVGKLVTYGTQAEEIRITGSLERMAQYFADPNQVAGALAQRNVIQSAGHFEAEESKVPLRTTGVFNTEEEVRNVLVDVSKDGHPVYIRDFADVQRRYEDPSFLVRYDGQPCLLLSVEMQKGKNIVDLGEELQVVFTRLQTLLPPDVQIDLVANQPEVVKERIASLSHEVLLALVAVIVVTILLLPLRVALIAAMAIPISLCGTLGVMEAMGMALHQVSIAGIIMVLGIVVDNAIVIVDQYVELLDHKVPVAEAAWRSASDVFVPVLVATITIIASFLPLLILTGSVGEFIRALPITVAIALAVSFIVAAYITPLLCSHFIKKGLHDDAAHTTQKKGLLDRLQDGYAVLIGVFMTRKGLAYSLGVGAVVAGVGLFTLVPQQFFPSAERNQFVIDVWMSQGTRIETTAAAMQRIEKTLAAASGVEHYATFVGQSAPRFYYNVNPQQPDGAYGQMIVNTASVADTSRLVRELRPALASLVPEAMVIVKELQQGSQMEAPIEVRISGDDVAELKQLGGQVQRILEDIPASQYVHRDFFNDSYRVDLNVNDELATRLGLTDASVSQTLAGAFDGYPVSTFWEGDRAVTIKLRLEPEARSSFADIGNTYVNSDLTRARVPLRAVAHISPEWQTSRIVRRNGVRTLTVRAFPAPGVYASTILKQAMPKFDALRLPIGYRLDYGGEKDNQDETFPQMLVALAISLVAIFLILLVQFRRLSEPVVVMASIPLTLLGAAIGLLVTNNPFGFTSFMGVISLCGIVVRNGIILVGYCNERIAEGASLEQAAREAGARRLRPIFLTSMAAAVGMVPMILSGSSLWSPLASVMAFGLVFSMFFTLLVVPVLFVTVQSRVAVRRAIAAPVTAALLACAWLANGSDAYAQAQAQPATRQLTLSEAVQMAKEQNSHLKIARAKVTETSEKIKSVKSQYFPQLSNNTKYVALSESQLISIPTGSLGTIAGMPFPDGNTDIAQSGTRVLLSETTVGQPTTQLLKIHELNQVAYADRGIAAGELTRSENETVLAVHQLYYALLVAKKERVAVLASVEATQEVRRAAEATVKAGNVLNVALTGATAKRLQAEQSLLVADARIADVMADLNDLLGLPSDEVLEVSEAGLPPLIEAPIAQAHIDARTNNGELIAAQQTVEKARHAVTAAKYEFIPDVTIFAKHAYQDGAAFLKDQVGVFGVEMNWNIFDWGKRRGEVGQRAAQLAQARENASQIDRRISIDIDKAYRKLERAKQMMDTAREALSYDRENARLSGNGLRVGTVTPASYAESIASLRKSEALDLQASLAYRLAAAELDQIRGVLAARQ